MITMIRINVTMNLMNMTSSIVICPQTVNVGPLVLRNAISSVPTCETFDLNNVDSVSVAKERRARKTASYSSPASSRDRRGNDSQK